MSTALNAVALSLVTGGGGAQLERAATQIHKKKPLTKQTNKQTDKHKEQAWDVPRGERRGIVPEGAPCRLAAPHGERQEGSWRQGWGLAPGRATEPLEECGLGTQAARGLGVP